MIRAVQLLGHLEVTVLLCSCGEKFCERSRARIVKCPNCGEEEGRDNILPVHREGDED